MFPLFGFDWNFCFVFIYTYRMCLDSIHPSFQPLQFLCYVPSGRLPALCSLPLSIYNLIRSEPIQCCLYVHEYGIMGLQALTSSPSSHQPSIAPQLVGGTSWAPSPSMLASPCACLEHTVLGIVEFRCKLLCHGPQILCCYRSPLLTLTFFPSPSFWPWAWGYRCLA